MKTAQTKDGIPIPANEDAPSEATCPYCGGIVILRRRKLMNSRGYSYYWRHLDNKNRSCPGRSRSQP